MSKVFHIEAFKVESRFYLTYLKVVCISKVLKHKSKTGRNRGVKIEIKILGIIEKILLIYFEVKGLYFYGKESIYLRGVSVSKCDIKKSI